MRAEPPASGTTGPGHLRVLPRLDAQLPEERQDGLPSRADFEARDLLGIVEAFAQSWDDLPRPYDGHEGYRLLVVTGQVVRAISVVGQLAPDGVVELVRVTIDTSAFPKEDDESAS